MEIKFENWKNGKQAVIRNSKGQLISRRKLKGSGIRTKAKAIKIFKKNGTLAKDTVTISRRKPDIKISDNKLQNIKGKKIQIKTDKGTVTIKDAIGNITLIGKNTAYVKSKEPIKNQNYYQYVVTATWGEDNIKTIGYSNMKSKGGTIAEAFKHAYGMGMEKLGINYEWSLIMTGDFNGELHSPRKNSKGEAREIITFTYTVEVGTYVQTAKNTL